MKTCLTTLLAASLVFTAGATTIVAQGKGAIGGTVVDEKGIAISNARVNANPINGRLLIGFVRYIETDVQGRFLIDRLDWGTYGVFAMKEDANYPNMYSSLYSNGVFPTATIDPAAPMAEIRIQLGPKAGLLIGSVSNAVTGGPVGAGFKLTRAASRDKWLSTSAPPNYRILLPSSTDVLLEVSAPGFKTWNPGHPLHSEPGAETRLDILLEPSHDMDLHPSRFLVPEGFLGWLLLEYNVKDAEPSRIEAGVRVFKFPSSGALNTSGEGPERGADDEYFYYSADGSLRQIPTDYRNGKGMIWGQHEGTRNGILSQFGFFIGTEEQYRKYQSQATHPGRIPAS
jgi:hypothetical protein